MNPEELLIIYKHKVGEKTLWFHVGEPQCSQCGEHITYGNIVVAGYSKELIGLYCPDKCWSAMKKIMSIKGFSGHYSCFVVEEKPEFSVPFILKALELKHNKMLTTFEAANPKYDKFIGADTDESEIVDNTKLAGRPDVVGIEMVEKSRLEFAKREQELTKELTGESEIDDILGQAQSSMPTIEFDEKKRLELKQAAEEEERKLLESGEK